MGEKIDQVEIFLTIIKKNFKNLLMHIKISNSYNEHTDENTLEKSLSLKL